MKGSYLALEAVLIYIKLVQAYQADLLKDADVVGAVTPAEIEELRRSSDLALRATKQAARHRPFSCCTGRHGEALVA